MLPCKALLCVMSVVLQLPGRSTCQCVITDDMRDGCCGGGNRVVAAPPVAVACMGEVFRESRVSDSGLIKHDDEWHRKGW